LDKATHEWVLNGEKIFVTAGHKSLCDSEGLVVVWATIDPNAQPRQAGMRAFVIPAKTPGVKVSKPEHKMGIRVSDTAAIVLQDCRVPFDHILEPGGRDENHHRSAALWRPSRHAPPVAATAIGRPALPWTCSDLLASKVAIRCGLVPARLTNEREVIDMEVMLRSAWLLVVKAVWMADNGKPT
jgi:acyl-CoA dehydrogenase